MDGQVLACIFSLFSQENDSYIHNWTDWSAVQIMICSSLSLWQPDIAKINTLRPETKWTTFCNHIFKRIFFNENVWISIKISLKFVPKGPINNIPSLVRIMARRRSGDKPLNEPMMVSLPTHICITRPQWVNTDPSLALWVLVMPLLNTKRLLKNAFSRMLGRDWLMF